MWNYPWTTIMLFRPAPFSRITWSSILGNFHNKSPLFQLQPPEINLQPPVIILWTSIHPPIASRNQPPTCDQPQTSNNLPPTSSKQPPTSSNHPLTSSYQCDVYFLLSIPPNSVVVIDLIYNFYSSFGFPILQFFI